MGEFAGKVRRQNTGAAAAAGLGTLKRLNFTRQQRRSFTTAAAGAGGGECADPGAGVTTLCRTSGRHLATPPLVTASILGNIFSPELRVQLSMEKLVLSTILR